MGKLNLKWKNGNWYAKFTIKIKISFDLVDKIANLLRENEGEYGIQELFDVGHTLPYDMKFINL